MKDELKKALEGLRDKLEKATEEKMEAAKKDNAEKVKSFDEKIEALEKQISEKEAEVSKKDITVLKDEFQKQMDAMQAEVKKAKKEKWNKQSGFGDLIQKCLEEQKDNLVKMSKNELGSLQFQAKDITTGSISMASGSTAINPGIASQTIPGIITPQVQPHVRNFLPTGTMDGAGVYYIQQSSWTPNAGYQAGEGATKTRVDAELETVYAPAVTIAAILKVSRQAMDDIKFLSSYLNSQAPEQLMLFEDQEILYGSGATNHLKGLFTAASSYTPDSGDDNQYDKLLTAMKELATGNYVSPTAAWVNAGDYYDFLKIKDNDGTYQFPPTVVNGGGLSIAGKPIIPLPGVTAGDFLVGNFNIAAQLLFREGINVRIFEQNDTDVEDNMLTIRIEERVALPIYRPYAMLKGDFTPGS